jgi:predicted RNA-binding Zn-ribbon protein involved in translation (DUF1610 family)
MTTQIRTSIRSWIAVAATCVSTALLCLVIVLWWRDLATHEDILKDVSGFQVSFASEVNSLSFSWDTQRYSTLPGWIYRRSPARPGRSFHNYYQIVRKDDPNWAVRVYGCFGYGWIANDWSVVPQNGRNRTNFVQAPSWFFILCFGLFPARRLMRKIRKARRRRSGLCVFCGYDLRASSFCCPECGQTAQARVTKQKTGHR